MYPWQVWPRTHYAYHSGQLKRMEGVLHLAGRNVFGEVKSTGGSSRGPVFDYQHPHAVSHMVAHNCQ